jgi:hypothetical protein
MDEEVMTGARRVRLEWVGTVAGGITLACLLIGQSVEQFADRATTPPIEAAQVKPHFNSIDYATTASIKSGVVVIGPCDLRKP